MRDLKIGEKTVRVRATPPALLFYRQEFKRDLLGDLLSLSQAVKVVDGKQEFDWDNFNLLILLQVVWAMARADQFGSSFPDFLNWLNSFEHIDYADPQFAVAALEEAAAGFFRGKSKAPAAAGRGGGNRKN